MPRPKPPNPDDELTPEDLEMINEATEIYLDDWEKQIDEFFDNRFAATSEKAERSRKKKEATMVQISKLERGTYTRNGHRFLRRACEGWVERLVQYHRVVKRQHDTDDWPFWYGERPLIGFFSAGLWHPGSACMEEYQADKKAEHVAEFSKPRKSTYLGRGDLYFSIGGRAANVEFKRHDIGISQTDHFEASLKAKVREGRTDAKRAHQAGIDDYFGMFLRPYIGSNRDARTYEPKLRMLLKSITKTIEPDGLSWWCPLKRVLDSDHKTKNMIVGVILVLKQV